MAKLAIDSASLAYYHNYNNIVFISDANISKVHKIAIHIKVDIK